MCMFVLGIDDVMDLDMCNFDSGAPQGYSNRRVGSYNSVTPGDLLF